MTSDIICSIFQCNKHITGDNLCFDKIITASCVDPVLVKESSLINLVLVNPPLSIEARYGVKSQSGGQTPPFGLACLAAAARSRGFETGIVDAAVLGLSALETAQEVVRLGATVVGLTAATIAIQSAAEVAAFVKQLNQNLTVLIGGPHLTALPEETMRRFVEFDIGVIGEGEITLTELLSTIMAGHDCENVSGLILRRGASTFRTPVREPIMDLDTLPPPAFDLLPDLAKNYCPPVHTVRRLPAALLVASRGCPGKCVFCDRSVFGNRLRSWSADYTLRIIEELVSRYGIKEIQIRDDNFLAFPKRLEELCLGLINRQLDLIWTCAGRVDMVTPERLELMHKAGCWQIWYGIESGNEEILQKIGKYITLAQIHRAVKMTKAAGIQPCGFFIIGHPGETDETMQETIDLACRLPLSDAHFSFMTPFPGSELYVKAREFGTFQADWSDLNGWKPTFVPQGLTAEDLERASKRAFRSFYFRARIIIEYLRRIRSIAHLKLYFYGFRALLQWLTKTNTSVSGDSSLTKV